MTYIGRSIGDTSNTDSTREYYHKVAERQLPVVWQICVVRLAGFEKSSIEDAVQEVFVRWLDTKPEFHNSGHEKAWFIRVAINVCTDVLRNADRHKTIPLDECDYLIGACELDLSLNEREIIKQMLTLPDSCRDVVYLYYVEGYNTSEIAKILSKKPNTVWRELSRGRQELRKKLKGF